MYTYQDAIDNLLDFAGIQSSTVDSRYARRAILEAYRELANSYRWCYYHTVGRITTNAPYGEGTVAYDHTGGAYERMLTLSGGTWPSWANLGSVIIGTAIYDVEDRKSDTIVTLAANTNPGADLDAGTDYTLYRDTYTAPSDLLSMDKLFSLTKLWVIPYLAPEEWLKEQRWLKTTGLTYAFTVMGDPKVPGGQAIRFTRSPSLAETFDYPYYRSPRPLRIYSETAGTVSIAADGVTVTGAGTAFTSRHVGSVIRIGLDGTNIPTGLDGDHPYAEEQVIKSVESATSLTVQSTFSQALSDVKFRISDPIDINVQTMLSVFRRLCEKALIFNKNMQGKAEAIQLANAELKTAMGSDAPYYGSDTEGTAVASDIGRGLLLRDVRTDL